MKHNYLTGGLLLFALTLGSCSDDPTDLTSQTVTEGNTPILFTGALSRATGNDCGENTSSTYSNIHLSADTDNGTSNGNKLNYFNNVAINEASLPSSTSEDSKATLTTTEKLHYPLSTGLRFFAYSGNIDDSRKLTLTAGNGIANDIILSNGIGDDEGKGTYGNENITDPINLTFRHVMTKIFVAIEVDKSDGTDEGEYVDPDPTNIEITLNDGLAVASGKYPITAKATPVANNGTTDVTDPSGNYILKQGVNYLVPNGAELTGTNVYPIKGLKIDDYTATAADCKALTITPANGNSKEIKLLPGQAYGLVFKIKRLEVTEITFKQIDWDTVVLGNESSSYVPATLKMDLGSYVQTEVKDTITKVVLHANDNKQYVGNILYKEDGSKKPYGQFVTLPATVTSVDLYTSKGLLVAGVVPHSGSYQADNSSSTNKKITLTLSAGGMKTKSSGENNATNPYLVETPVQFCNISKALAVSYEQVNDLDLEALTEPFTPFTEFTGTYDGNGKRILHASFTGNGLFAKNSGTIKNIRIASGKITATGTHAGSICGENSGTIVACINEAQIHGSATHAGGICGKNSGSIIACLNTGDIFTRSNYSGGICGENTSTTAGAITACVNVGMMNRGSGKMAGICGVTTSENNPLKACYWLTGTAKEDYDDNSWGKDKTEVAAYTATGDYTPGDKDDVADLSPQKLRDSNTGEKTGDEKKTTALLNAAISNTWKNDYEFTYNVATNGCVWPMPVKKATNP